ncbi:hypothetical protein OAN76_02595 [Candidatus Marinimicrobia bacterium]|nr:hypothetical protein [Candidatus Neomarinimicrobiota bacterium]
MNTDSVRVASTGLGGSVLSGLEFLPDLLSVLCGLITLLYMSLQLQKEYTNAKEEKRKKRKKQG